MQFAHLEWVLGWGKPAITVCLEHLRKFGYVMSFKWWKQWLNLLRYNNGGVVRWENDFFSFLCPAWSLTHDLEIRSRMVYQLSQPDLPPIFFFYWSIISIPCSISFRCTTYRTSFFLGVAFWKYLGSICPDVNNLLSSGLPKKFVDMWYSCTYIDVSIICLYPVLSNSHYSHIDLFTFRLKLNLKCKSSHTSHIPGAL